MAQAQRARSNGDRARTTDDGTRRGCEFHAGPVAGTAVISGATFGRKALQYAESNGLAIFEGDIILGTVEEVRAAAAGADAGPVLASVGITGQQFRWPNAQVPFEIDPGLPNQQRVTDAIAHWEANTPIRFVQRTASNAAQFPDFVRFVNGGGCSSHVGRRGGMQQITLGPGCTTGNAIHEIGHAVGLWHEQSREDRDTFVRIEWANIDPSMQHNFDQHIADGDDLGPYDYGSIMHYPATAFSTNGQPTIVPLQPLPPGVVMGQRNGLSAGDIAGVRALYPTLTIKEVRKDPVIDVPRKLPIKDPTVDVTIKEARKDPIVDATRKELTKDPIFDPTIKEGSWDPGPTLVENVRIRPPVYRFGTEFAGAAPFMMAAPSHFGDDGAGSSLLEAQVQAVGEALAAAQAQLAQIAAGYEALCAALAGQQVGAAT